MDHLPPVDSLSLHEAVGQLICPTLFGGDRQGRVYDPVAARNDLERYGWGGYILFHGSKAEVSERVSDLQEAARIPLLVAADLEHGAGQQVAGLSVFPTAMAFGAAREPAHAYELGAWTAREALSVGINWVLAPVADVTNNPLNPIINIRSFGGDPALVARLVEAFVLGCQSQGALACAKHFPGHGDTSTDSHAKLGVVTAERARLAQVELPPFQAAIGAGVASVMTAHLAVPALDAPDVPATLSPAILTDLLRRELGFSGLVVTDALVMGGITRTLDPVDAAVLAVRAGCDMLLMPPDPALTFEALYEAARSGRLDERRVYEAAGRVLAAKARLRRPPHEPLKPTPEALARHVAAQAITLAKGDAGRALPEGTFCLAIDDGVESERLDVWRHALEALGLRASAVVTAGTSPAIWAELLAEAGRAPAVLAGVFSPIRVSKERSLMPPELVEPLRRLAAAHPMTLVSFSSPFLVAQVPEAARWVLAYGSRPVQIEAALAGLRAGEFPGRLPVTLPELPLPALGKAWDGSTGPSFA